MLNLFDRSILKIALVILAVLALAMIVAGVSYFALTTWGIGWGLAGSGGILLIAVGILAAILEW